MREKRLSHEIEHLKAVIRNNKRELEIYRNTVRYLFKKQRGEVMDLRKEFDENWEFTKQYSKPGHYMNQPGMQDIAYSWFLVGWNLNQEKGKVILVNEIRKFLDEMKT